MKTMDMEVVVDCEKHTTHINDGGRCSGYELSFFEGRAYRRGVEGGGQRAALSNLNNNHTMAVEEGEGEEFTMKGGRGEEGVMLLVLWWRPVQLAQRTCCRFVCCFTHINYGKSSTNHVAPCAPSLFDLNTFGGK